VRARHAELRNTVTDLLIGDLFTDKVDKVWQPMELLYQPGKMRLMTWREGTTEEQSDQKASQLVLPEGRRP
jgi:hypothetical protein